MITHYRLVSAGGASSFISLFGTAALNFGPPSSASVNGWIEKSILIDSLSIHASVAPGAGKSHVQQYFEGAVQKGNTVTLSDTNTDVTGAVNALIPASANATDTFAHAFKTSPSVGTAIATLLYTHLYKDIIDPNVSFFPWGDGSTNIVYPGSPTFMGFYARTFNATEGVNQTVMPSAGVFERAFLRYTTSAGTNYDIEIRVNGVLADTVTVVGVASGTLYAEAINVVVNAGDLVSFRINRTLGAGTAFIMWSTWQWRAR